VSDAPRPARYDAFAASFAEHSRDGLYNALYDRALVRELLGDVAGLAVLDAGCGAGWLVEELLERSAARVLGCDLSGELIAIASARLGDRAELRVHDLQHPLDWLDDASVDRVVLQLVIHHIDDRVSALRELHRVLRPDGRLVVTTHHPMLDWLRLGGSYFDVAKVEEVWEDGWEVAYWRQPLSDVIDEYVAAGFLVERLAEPRPSAAVRERDADEHAKLASRPAFLGVSLVKRS
jgi:SAM-dependent methyltransferase